MDKVSNFIDKTELVKIIVGVRRSGKSVLLELIMQELLKRGVDKNKFISLNFENLDLEPLTTYQALHSWLKDKLNHTKGRYYLFLDEIQEVSEWEKVVNSLRTTHNVDIYITGSNAQLITGEYATRLSGRYIQIVMYPFSFSEYKTALRKDNNSIKKPDKELFMSYLRNGGMPFSIVNRLSEVDNRQYLKDIYTSVLIKDVMSRNKFRDIDILERIVAYVLANIGQPFSANSIANYFKSEKRSTAPETVLKYLKACEDAYLIYKAKRFDVPSKRQLKIDEKYYVVDHGLRQAAYGNNERDIERLLENIVYMELRRRGYEVMIGRVADKEIDFIADKGEARVYIQVSYLLASQTTILREFSVYADIKDNFPKYVVSMDEVDFSRDGIQHRNICEFLLSDEY
jgi:predicted AAA+ superfamily ATPase